MQQYDEATVDSRILQRLDHLEKILWIGTPPKAMTLRPTDALYVLGPILFVVFTLSLGIPIPWYFVLVPLGLPISYLMARFEKANTVYALTDRQVMIFGQLIGNHKERLLKLTELSELFLDERPDGSGTIRFSRYWPLSAYISDIGPTGDKTPAHMKVGPGKARQVYELIEQAREAARIKADT